MNCLNCGKPLTGRQKKWCSILCSVKAWDKAHPNRAAERFRKYQASDKGKEVQRSREYQENRKTYKSDYMKTPKGKEIAKNKSTRRVNRRRGVEASFTISDWKSALEYFNYKCAYCGDELTKAEQDHFVPLSRGGSYTKNNIVPACRSCNGGKSNKNPIEWLAGLPNALIAYARIVAYLKIFN